MQGRLNPVLQSRNPARFSVLPGGNQLSKVETFQRVDQKTRLDYGPGGLGSDVLGLAINQR